MKLRVCRRAQRDLAEIAEYLSSVSPSGARSVEQGIRRTFELIGVFPRSGRVPQQRPAVRVMPVGRHPYLVFYTTSHGQIVVLHIRHGARKSVAPESL